MKRWIRALVRRQAAEPPESHLDRLIMEGVVSMGQGSYGRPTVVVWRDHRGRPSGGNVRIGNYCSISQDVEIYTGGEHRTDWVTTWPARVLLNLEGKWDDGHPATRGDVVIGHDVWIARGATLRSGVSIGNGAVIGARSIVTKDIPPYAIAAGNPARIIRYRFDEATIAELERIAWWEWTEEEVRDAVELLCSSDVSEFVSRYG